MALSRRTGARFQASIWPGFVDAMTGLMLVLMFVITIFMVLQFVLRETITGQETQLSALSQEVAALADALGLEQDRAADLETQVGALDGEVSQLQSTLQAREAEVAQQASLIADLTGAKEALTQDLAQATDRITGFEAQVAGLLADQQEANATIADLQTREAELLDAEEALNLALAQARTEIDAEQEAARLAAARAAALDALLTELREQNTDLTQNIASAEDEIDALEAAQLADAAAAQALRDRLSSADAELTAMTLALEAQRQEAEDSLTLLAAAQAAQEDVAENLAIALLAQEEAEAAADALGVERADLAAQLAEVLEEQDAQTTGLLDVEDRLAAALVARTDLEDELAAAEAAQDGLRDELAAAVAALAAARSDQTGALSEADRQAALLAQANAALAQEEALSAESQREVAALNAQVATLRGELGRLQGLLDLAEDADVAANVQIESLTQDLNTAMARALVAERRTRELEQAEVERLAAEAEELERYRSDFLGLLRDVLEDVEGVRIVGDRFVFSSEVLFEPGAAALSPEGRGEIAKVAAILRDVAGDIPAEIDWVIRVDGHTDNVPLSGRGAFANNWELSQARALSVVLYMVEDLGIPPERLAANGFGQYQPINPDDTEAARAQNRRIELKLTER